MNIATAHHHAALPSPPVPSPPETCFQGHRTTLILSTSEGGVICLVCLSNLISNPKSPTVHVSYALSQLSSALSQPQFLNSFITFHSHFLVSPLVHYLSSFNDAPIAQQIIDLVLQICEFADSDVYGEFVARISDRLSSGSLAWSRQQLYVLHCMGVLLDHQKSNPYIYVKDKNALVFNLITGLQLTSEEIQGEVLFVLYKISLLQYEYKDDSVIDAILDNCGKLLHLSLEALMKTQSDDVRLNCIALLTVLARRIWSQDTCLNEVERKNSFQVDNFMQIAEQTTDGPPLNSLFAEAIKAPLLSSNAQVQVAALDLVFLYLSWEGVSGEIIEELVEENIADYVFEILRLSGCKDPLVNSCIRVLDVLSTAEQAFRQRLAIGFTTIVPVLHYVAEVPFHPSQTQSLKLVWSCVSNNPGIVSNSHGEEISGILIGMLKKHIDGESDILPETFNLVCLTLVALTKCSPFNGTSNFLTSLSDSSRNAILACLNDYDKHPEQFLYSLYLLKEAYAYSCEENLTSTINMELRSSILDICKEHLLPWFMITMNTIEDEATVLGVIEALHSLLLQESDIETKLLIDTLLSSSWSSHLFGCLGFFPSEKMKFRIYLMFSSIVDVLLGSDCGQIIRDAALSLPSDPIDSLFLLGQNSSHNLQLITCQSAILLVLYVSSLYDDRFADDKLVLASLEQFILLNVGELFFYGASSLVRIDLLINLYGLYRGIAKINYQIPYSPEAEKILFQIIDDKKWDLISTRIHFISLKWLFQQEKIFKSLSEQILKLCRLTKLEENPIVLHGRDSWGIELRSIAELIISGDNFAAMIFICLLEELAEQDGQADDINFVINTLIKVIEILPSASDRMSMHGLARSFQKLCSHSIYSCSATFTATSQLVFIFLRSVQSKSLSDDEGWVEIVIKFMDYLIYYSVAKDCWTEQSLVVVGTLSLVLYHSSNKVLIEASRIILLSNPLASILNKTITEACLKGPALIDVDEETRTGEILIFLLLLKFFSFRCVEAVLPGMSEWLDLLDEYNDKKQLLTYNSLHCQDFCKLLHFGSPLIKLVSSHCLLELFNRVSADISRKPDGLKIQRSYLLSVMAVLEGLIFSSDISVSTNCSICLSMLIGWEELDKGLSSAKRSYWCRLIVEELAKSLTVPCLASKSFMIHYKPAVHVAVALLKLKKIPPWMTSIFDDSCICGIIQNISTSNLSSELVLLLRELLKCGFLKAEQVASLNRVFQAWRKHLYANESQNHCTEKEMEIMDSEGDEVGKVCAFLINLMSSLSSHDMGQGRLRHTNKQLLAEIELFAKYVAQEHEV